MRPNDDVPRPTEPEPPDFEPDLDRRRDTGEHRPLPTPDVPEPPNRDDVRPDDDVEPDVGTVEPPD
ncbi:hypothetical protein [Saccharomonospora sp. NB11]|jgi:hypothetical protein|uniref:hypothetical protein n=1 Tax=Saccharomonospora sp. NB11 TaxID=1642298 RepID=UPI0018D055FF|nr:hypothetical protein [Saccharomonospora sp. NB11]